jgi:hypothetical protein
MEEIINWLHELIAGVHVIKTGENKAAGKEAAGAATGADTDSSTCYSLSLFCLVSVARKCRSAVTVVAGSSGESGDDDAKPGRARPDVSSCYLLYFSVLAYVCGVR